jgi:FkbM family methyltransferase
MLREIRDRFHPLHGVRRNKVLSTAVLPRIDVTVRMRLADVDWPVYVRLGRHQSHSVNSRVVEPGTKSLFGVLIDHLSPNCFWDVGANFGIYSWLFLSRVRNGTAILLEPEPDNLTLLRRTVTHSNLSRVTCLPIAASDQSSQAIFYRDPVTGVTGGLRSDTEPYISRHYGRSSPPMTVQTTTLDDLATKQPSPDLVKIDVEGAELSVLGGARKLLEEHQPVVLFEAQEHHRDEAVAMLSESGYFVQPSSGPDESISSGVDFVAVPARFHDVWREIRQDWTDRLRQG